MDRRWAPWAAAAGVAALAAYAYVVRVRFLLSSPYPFGVDGFYYPVQVRALLETGQLNYPSAPLVFWLAAPLALLTDPIVGVKILSAAGTALAVVPIYLIARRLTGERGPALLGAAIGATSASSAYLSTEFVKEGVGLTIAAGFVAALGAALDRPTRARRALAAALFAAAVLAHKAAAGLALVVGLPAAGVALWRQGRRREVGIAAGVAALVPVVGALAPGVLGWGDLRLLGRALSASPAWTLPALELGRFSLRFGHEALATGLVALALAALAIRRREAPAPLAVGLIALAALIALPWLDVRDTQGVGFRLRVAAFVVLAPLAALLVRQTLAGATASTRALVALGAALGLLVARPAAGREGVVRAAAPLVQAVRALEGAVPPDAVVVTPDRQVAFMARWYARQPMRIRQPQAIDPALTYRLIPRNLMDPDFVRALDALRAERPEGVPPPRDLAFMPNDLVLLPELAYRWVLERLPERSRARWLAWRTT